MLAKGKATIAEAIAACVDHAAGYYDADPADVCIAETHPTVWGAATLRLYIPTHHEGPLTYDLVPIMGQGWDVHHRPTFEG